ncbi:hypothetical protein GGX14DRAFT_393972 [Mycena pura]|uniref:Uncharacterized protein n=1 Tax=Mycena pura TaxID=153505 RepID=A0AAD6VFN5_9AGAR|nr:hypothetical protein GGX14DRAFT_393972 [Mycena pura]
MCGCPDNFSEADADTNNDKRTTNFQLAANVRMDDPTAGFRVHAVVVGQRFTGKELDEERLINMDGNGVGTVVLLETRSPPVARDPIELSSEVENNLGIIFSKLPPFPPRSRQVLVGFLAKAAVRHRKIHWTVSEKLLAADTEHIENFGVRDLDQLDEDREAASSSGGGGGGLAGELVEDTGKSNGRGRTSVAEVPHVVAVDVLLSPNPNSMHGAMFFSQTTCAVRTLHQPRHSPTARTHAPIVDVHALAGCGVSLNRTSTIAFRACIEQTALRGVGRWRGGTAGIFGLSDVDPVLHVRRTQWRTAWAHRRIKTGSQCPGEDHLGLHPAKPLDEYELDDEGGLGRCTVGVELGGVGAAHRLDAYRKPEDDVHEDKRVRRLKLAAVDGNTRQHVRAQDEGGTEVLTGDVVIRDDARCLRSGNPACCESHQLT